jgi:hypothetical protein
MFREVIDLRNKVVELENRRTELVKEKLEGFMRGEKSDLDEIVKVITAEKGLLELLRLKLREERDSLSASKDKLKSKLNQLKKEKKFSKSVKRCLDIAFHNLQRHDDLLEKFVDKMMKGLEITEQNLQKLKLGNFDFDEDPNSFFKEASKYLAEEDACINNTF